MVSLDNYEEYLVLQADGELDAAGQKELNAFLEAHPELKEEEDLYAKLRLVPDMNEVFENKESLLRKETKVIGFGNWRQYSAAAGILILIAIGIMKWGKDDTTTIAKTIDTIEQVQGLQNIAIDTPAPVQEEHLAAEEEKPVKKEPIIPQSQQQRPQQVQIANVKENKTIPHIAIPERIMAVKTELLAGTTIEKPIAKTVTIPELKINNEPAPEPHRDALAWLPISEEKKEGLNILGQTVNKRLEKVRAIKDDLKDTDLAVKLGKKELFVVRF